MDGIFKRGSGYGIPWEKIKKVGDDVIFVDINPITGIE